MVKFLFSIVVLVVLCNCRLPVSDNLQCTCPEGSSLNEWETSFEEVKTGEMAREQIVVLTGFFQYNFEDVAIYSDKGSKAEALWVNLNMDIDSRCDSALRRLSGRKVSIAGKIDPWDKGHMGAYLGSISGVICIREVK